MNEWRQFSRLPESPEYWRGLQGRIGRAAQPMLLSRTTRHRWLDAALATSVLAAAAVFVLLIMRPPPPSTSPSFQASLAPTDPIASALLNSRQAPDISVLLSAYAARRPE